MANVADSAMFFTLSDTIVDMQLIQCGAKVAIYRLLYQIPIGMFFNSTNCGVKTTEYFSIVENITNACFSMPT
tara:strand:+ start:80803 stop:81021 length:219 start_codon:yes stop_codon:yes gene_type:complete